MRSRVMRLAVLSGACLSIACSTTTDDPRAAYRAAFGSDVPADVVVNRAQLWENRHLFVFYEYSAHLELTMSDDALRRTMDATGVEFQPFDATNFSFAGPGYPDWFAPRGRMYEGWRAMDGAMYVVRDPATGRVFVDRSEL